MYIFSNDQIFNGRDLAESSLYEVHPLESLDMMKKLISFAEIVHKLQVEGEL